MTGLWVHVEGDPDHAILVLCLDGRDTVCDARADRMPENPEVEPFDREKWLSSPERRLRMVRDLAARHPLEGLPLDKVTELLGPPDGQSVYRDSPWELRVPCSLGLLNWDVFFYWPTKAYPRRTYGGRVERIGDWAYVHE